MIPEPLSTQGIMWNAYQLNTTTRHHKPMGQQHQSPRAHLSPFCISPMDFQGYPSQLDARDKA